MTTREVPNTFLPVLEGQGWDDKAEPGAPLQPGYSSVTASLPPGFL